MAFTEGINLREAEPLVPILVTTQNSRYRIIPLRWGDSDVLVQGGLFFPEPTEARLAGSTFGGSSLKMHWITVGMHMEINTGHGGGPIITTRVADVRIQRDRTTNTRRHQGTCRLRGSSLTVPLRKFDTERAETRSG